MYALEIRLKPTESPIGATPGDTDVLRLQQIWDIRDLLEAYIGQHKEWEIVESLVYTY